MATGPSTEAAVRAVVENRPAAPRTEVERQAAAIRTEMAKNGPRSALEAMAQNRRKPLESGKIDQMNDKNIGTEHDTTGKKVRTDRVEQDRFDKAGKYSKQAKEFLEKGFDGLVGDIYDASTDKGQVYQLVETTLRSLPDADALLTGLGPADRKATIEALLKNPELAAKVKGVFEGIINSGEIPDLVAAAKRARDEAKQKEDQKKRELDRTNSDKGKADSDLSEFNTAVGKGADKLRDLTTREADIKIALDGKIAELDSYKQRMRGLQTTLRIREGGGLATADIETKINDLQTEMTAAQTETNRLNGELREKRDLEEKRIELQNRQRKLEDDKKRLEAEHKAALEDVGKTEAGLIEATSNRVTAETNYVDQLRGVFSDATAQYLEEKIRVAEEAQAKVIEDDKTKATSGDEKTLLNSMTTRWENDKGKYDKRGIDADYGLLVSSGPDVLMRRMLTDAGMTPTQVTERMKDPAFIEKMQSQVVEKILTRKMQTGKISGTEARRIAESEWGQGMLQKALEKKTELKALVDKMKADGVIKGTFMWDGIKDMTDGNLLKFLLLILGGVATAGVLPVALAGSGAVSRALKS